MAAFLHQQCRVVPLDGLCVQLAGHSGCGAGIAPQPVTLNPDRSTTARSPDGTKIMHSHSPPTARAG